MASRIDWEAWVRGLTCSVPGCRHPATLNYPACHHAACRGHENGPCIACSGAWHACGASCAPWAEREWREHFGVLTELHSGS